MLNLGLLNSIPSVHIVKEFANKLSGNGEHKRKSVYDPETSVYSSKQEHDVCQAIRNWNRY